MSTGAAVLRLAACFILLSTFSLTGIYSQNILHPDSIIAGKYKISVSLLAGLSTRSNDFYGNDTKSGPHLNLSGIYYFSRSKAVKLDLNYSYFKSGNNDLPASFSEHPSYFEGGDVNHLALKANMLIGMFKPEDRILLYGSLGLGVYSNISSDFKETVFNFDDSTYHTYVHSTSSLIKPFVSLGGGFVSKFTKQFGLHAEIEYNYSLAYILNGEGHLAMRAGIIYIFF